MQKINVIYVTKTTSIEELCRLDKDNSIILIEEYYIKGLLEKKGFCNVEYIDSFIISDSAEKYNKLMYDYALNWFCDKNGVSHLKYKNVDLGPVFLYVFTGLIATPFLQFFLVMLELTKKYHVIKVLLDDKKNYYLEVLNILNLDYELFNLNSDTSLEYSILIKNKYFEPEHLFYLTSANRLMFNLKNIYRGFERNFKALFNGVFHKTKKSVNVLVSNYYPTRPAIKALKKSAEFQVYYINEIDFFHGDKKNNYACGKKIADNINELLSSELFKQKFKIEGFECHNYFKSALYFYVNNFINRLCMVCDSILYYLKKQKISLYFTAIEFGGDAVHSICLSACKSLGIPTLSIMNGSIPLNFYKENKQADYKIAYSQFIKESYLKDLKNVVVLGNPYFDQYSSLIGMKKGNIKKKYNIFINPVTNIVALNTTRHIEEEFLFDILSCIKQFEDKFNVFIKPHSSYNIKKLKYFLQIHKFDNVKLIFGTFIDKIKKADLYISDWSTTDYEAAILGIPVIYYKKDRYIFSKPYDGNSELITACSPVELTAIIQKFLLNPQNLKSLSDIKVLEKYIGYIDGNNYLRVLSFIEKLLLKNVVEIPQENEGIK